jgi:multidrug efflux pump subunit AcrA (membrane-fusion protein)
MTDEAPRDTGEIFLSVRQLPATIALVKRGVSLAAALSHSSRPAPSDVDNQLAAAVNSLREARACWREALSLFADERERTFDCATFAIRAYAWGLVAATQVSQRASKPTLTYEESRDMIEDVVSGSAQRIKQFVAGAADVVSTLRARDMLRTDIHSSLADLCAVLEDRHEWEHPVSEEALWNLETFLDELTATLGVTTEGPLGGHTPGVDVVMPQMGESVTQGTLVRWLKKVGEWISRDEALFEISTDKVDAEIPSPRSGILTEIRVGEGQTVPINTVVGVIRPEKRAVP